MDTLMIFALILFAVTYVLMFSLQKLRPYIALTSATIFVVVGSLGIFPNFHYTILDALSEIDWNVIMMIAGTMGTVYLFIESKMPQLLSDLIISKVSSVKWMIFAMSIFAGVISAFVDNVATVLMIAPVALAVCKKLHISPVPAIICISVSSNLRRHWWATRLQFCWQRRQISTSWIFSLPKANSVCSGSRRPGHWPRR